ncbi:hypothetical protein L798_08243 [Zootermopsis nevadensis]|uniref:Reverse transcriptase zinc-binding domain-containing protein n=1 Tax=Zootermopsis nevadensis TaxID=136037 RepID=A0A067R632_ZOONE|nr:hypothetical protein L798_08243 [Zootermopsis nevadensis]
MNGKIIETVKEICYLGVTLESTGGWAKQKAKVVAKGKQALVAIDKCLARMPHMRINILENVYEMVCESRMMYGAEIWGLEEGWKEVDVIHGRFCKKVLGIPRVGANGVAEVELGRDSRRSKVLGLVTKFWLRILQMDRDDLVRRCYDWQVLNLKIGGWAKGVKEELDKLGLGYIWQDPQGRSVGRTWEILKERCNAIERQNVFAKIREKRSLALYGEMKSGWGRQGYIGCCTRVEREGWAWFRAGIWKLRGMRGGMDGKICPLCGATESEIHILLKCTETGRWREQLLRNKWFTVGEELAFKKILSTTNDTEVRDLGKFLYKVRCKRQVKIRNLELPLR